MNWIKITKDTLPEFEKLVLLLEKSSQERKFYCHLGMLMNISKDGPVFQLQNSNSTDQLFNLFTGSNIKPVKQYEYYSEIDLTNLPND